MPAKKVFTKDEQAEIVRRYQAGESMQAIARAFRAEGKPTKGETLRRLLDTTGIEMRSRQRRFTPSVERQIVADYEAGANAEEMAVQYGCSAWAIREIARRHGAQIRPLGAQRRRFTDEEIALMGQMAQAGESQQAIGRTLRAHPSTISGTMRKHGLPPARRGQALRDKHGQWKGGRTKTSAGYCMVRLDPTDPLFVMSQGGNYVMEHRLVMARHLGRALERHETVHHINGDKTDNRIENLQLRQGKHGNGAAYVCLDCGSHNVAPKELT